MVKLSRSTFSTLLILLLRLKLGYACRISEFPCRGSSLCLPLDKYCDGRDDCGDATDEPKFCTVCNRTYYGDIGRTYSLRVPPPQWHRLPFLCHLTFTASGHDQGDIVQIIFDGFSVGRFDEGVVDGESDATEASLTPSGELPGCPEGFMQLSELGRPFTGGSWCGAATGYQSYYSETSTVTASVKVFHAPLHATNTFEFSIRYRFISQSDAIVRYGSAAEPIELGLVTPGTYCTRQFDECYRKKCRLQSPNFPGMYPRNVTCYWTIRQKEVPTCKHAMISVSQEDEHKALVKRSIGGLNKTARSIKAWSDCTGERDQLIFYDGSSTNDPVLAKFCGGDWLPRVVSRKSEMLVAFHSSPFSAPLQSGTPYRGFELNIDILFTDSDSMDYARGPKACEFHINATNPDEVLMTRRGRMGTILSPRHTLPPNTTCTYYFRGFPTDLVWISFTSYNLRSLQPITIDNTTVGKNEPSWITRLRLWDSTWTYTSTKTTLPPINNFRNNKNSSVPNNYYHYSSNNSEKSNINKKINLDNAWNPVGSYIYGPTSNTIYDQSNKYIQKIDKFENGLNKDIKESINYIAQNKYQKLFPFNSIHTNKETTTATSSDIGRQTPNQKSIKGSGNRKLLVEVYDNESPKLCDHYGHGFTKSKTRPCSPYESYVSSGSNMKIEFHTQTGTALHPHEFSLNYEFIDTNLGGDPWNGKKKDDVPVLCSRIFRNKRRGNFTSPRNVFLHGRGGAKNISCLYRFEASVGERIKLVLHNVSFGDTATCSTESDFHTGRPKCVPSDTDSETRIGELKIFDSPYKDVKIPIGCFCDNTSSLYTAPLTFISNFKAMELMFTVTRLNVSEDFADVYFHASYEIISVPDCPKKIKLKGSGGEDKMEYPLMTKESSCEGMSWYIEAQQQDRSIFVLTWGSFLPIEPTSEDILRCNTRNRLIVYSGKPLKVMKVICPAQPGSRSSALHIFSEDWLNNNPAMYSSRPVSLIIEPVFKEPGEVEFSWLEIQRTKAYLLSQLDLQTNLTANETFGELFPKGAECEHKCPELDACISSSLWCDGHRNCPSGRDESEIECGTARRILELSGGIFAALGCVAAAISACLIFCLFGLVRKRKKNIQSKSNSLNGTLKKEIKKEPLFMDPDS